MKILVLGASGKTGRILVKMMLGQGWNVAAIVRSKAQFQSIIPANPKLETIEAEISKLTTEQLKPLIDGCDVIASCLGHNLSFKGLFLPPRKLVRNAIHKCCLVAQSTERKRPVKLILMNSSGVRNPDAKETISLAQKLVISLLRALVPPHSDNEAAAAFLRKRVGRDSEKIEWVAVRPDGLIDATMVTEYDSHSSPIRSAIFNAGEVSRINVAHFMATLATDLSVWRAWKGQMPVLYNRD